MLSSYTTFTFKFADRIGYFCGSEIRHNRHTGMFPSIQLENCVRAYAPDHDTCDSIVSIDAINTTRDGLCIVDFTYKDGDGCTQQGSMSLSNVSPVDHAQSDQIPTSMFY